MLKKTYCNYFRHFSPFTMLIEFIYTSTVTRPLDPKEVINLQESCMHNNAQKGVTGMLLYDGQHFMQVLEGDSQTIETLFETIKHDSRHFEVSAIIRNPIENRNFAAWSMGVVDLTKTMDFKNTKIKDIRKSPPLSHKLLLAFTHNKIY